MLLGGLTPDEGTVSTMHLLFAELAWPSGRYYGSDAKRSPIHMYRKAGSAEYEGA